MHYIRLFVLCALSLSVLLPGRGEAADLYSVIYTDASFYNGAIYLRTQLDNFGGLGEYGASTAVAAYNAGSAAVYQYGGVPPYQETIDYVAKVHRAYMNLYQMYQYG